MGLRRVTNKIGPSLSRKSRLLAPIPKKGYDHFKEITPIDTGNAKSKTKFTNTSKGGSITGDYPYANRLNKGYSKQAPEGMTDPTIEHIRKEVKKVL